MLILSKRMVLIGVAALAGFGLCRAARFRFQDKEDAIYKECRAQLQKLGIDRGAAKAKYPTPEIHMVSSGCLLPGGTGEVVVKGKFAPGTKFVFQNDNLEVVKESLTGGEYRATLKVAPGVGPQTAEVVAISPVTGISARQGRAAVIGGRYEWTMSAANGWRIVARSLAAKACGNPQQEDEYEVLFFKNGGASPFEKRRAKLYHSMWESTNYRFSIDQSAASQAPGMQEFTDVMQRMSDPKLSNAEREKLMKTMMQAQAQMQTNLKKLADPAYQKQMQEQRNQFGCERLNLQVAAGSFTGEMRCSQQVGTQIGLTGSMKALGQ